MSAMKLRALIPAFAVTLLIVLAPLARAEDRFILLQSTTSPRDSGLYNHLLPMFKAKTGIDVRVVAVGTGQALKNAENGDADVVITHDPAAEEKFVADGFGVKRIEIMTNDFIIVGPKADPARVRGNASATEALKTIASKQVLFASRGDESGTHKIEKRLWTSTGLNPDDGNTAGTSWYRSTGSGMGATLNTASGLGAYTLTDRATWLAFQNRGDLEILVQGDPALFNLYAASLVNPARHPHVKVQDAETFISWISGAEGQSAIAAFRINGEQAFYPRNATGQ
jgi:tungstate transport system substrate-binding protein